MARIGACIILRPWQLLRPTSPYGSVVHLGARANSARFIAPLTAHSRENSRRGRGLRDRVAADDFPAIEIGRDAFGIGVDAENRISQHGFHLPRKSLGTVVGLSGLGRCDFHHISNDQSR
jgi:hypothetical protein